MEITITHEQRRSGGGSKLVTIRVLMVLFRSLACLTSLLVCSPIMVAAQSSPKHIGRGQVVRPYVPQAPGQKSEPDQLDGKLIVKLRRGADGNPAEIFSDALATSGVATPAQARSRAPWRKIFPNTELGAAAGTSSQLRSSQQPSTASAVAAAAQTQGLERIFVLETEDSAEAVKVRQQLANDPRVEYAEPNVRFSLYRTPDDVLYPQQWPLHNTGQDFPDDRNSAPGRNDQDIDAPQAWDQNTDCSNIVISVIDTGIDYNHPDLAANIWINPGEIPGNNIDDDRNGFIDDVRGYDFTGQNDSNPMDEDGHGTHVAGTVAAVGNNRRDIAGICWKAKVMSARFLASDGGTLEDALEALQYSVQNGATVLVNSWGGGPYTQSLQDVIVAARAAGVVVIAAAGNDATSTRFYPAAYEEVIAIAATNASGIAADFTSYGDWVDLSAPGVDILSLRASRNLYQDALQPTAETLVLSGTSMACPHAAGAAALLMSDAKRKGTPLSPSEVELRLLHNSDDVYAIPENARRAGQLGAGLLNVHKLISVTTPPAPRVTVKNTSTSAIPQPGGQFSLQVGLLNLGGRAENVQMTVTSANPQIRVVQSAAQIAFIDFKQTQAASFAIELSAPFPVPSNAIFSVTVSGPRVPATTTDISLLVPKLDMSWVKQLDVSYNREDLYPILSDLNGDGAQEIIVALPDPLINTPDSRIQHDRILVLDRNGATLPGWPVTLNSASYNAIVAISSADLDNDGSAEVAVSYLSSLPESQCSQVTCDAQFLAVYNRFGQLQPGYPKRTAATDVSGAPQLPLVDVDGDGKQDVVFFHTTMTEVPFSDGSTVVDLTDALKAYRASGAEIAGLSNAVPLEGRAGLSSALAFAATDLDLDRKAELSSPGLEFEQPVTGMLWSFSTQDKYAGRWPAATGPRWGTMSAGDIDGDGVPELVATQYDSTDNILTQLDNYGHLRVPAFGGTEQIPIYSMDGAILADLDGDGRKETIMADHAGKVSAYDFAGSPVRGWPVVTSSYSHLNLYGETIHYHPIAADVDGDSKAEILLWSFSPETPLTPLSHRNIAWLHAWNGDGTPVSGFPRAYPREYVGDNSGSAAIGDINGDGRLEIVSLRGQYSSREQPWPSYSGKTFISVLPIDAPFRPAFNDWPMVRQGPAQTNSHPGNRLAHPESKVSGTWNGFLDHYVVIECANKTAQQARDILLMFGADGAMIERKNLNVAPFGSAHTVLAGEKYRNSFGTFQLYSERGDQPVKLACHTMHYRVAPSAAGEPLDYAFSIPTADGSSGVKSGLFNSMDPGGGTTAVYNWLTIVNSDNVALNAQVLLYDLAGNALPAKTISVGDLGPGERIDYALGHPDGQTIGSYRIVPSDSSLSYQAFITRYAPNGSRFNFAFPLSAEAGTCASGSVPASTMDPALNWAEIGNVSSNETAVSIEVFAANGSLLGSEQHTLAPHSQVHIALNRYLGKRQVGSFQVRCTGSSGPRLVVQSLFYGQDPQNTAQIEWAYASQSLTSTAEPKQFLSFYNTFFGSFNWQKYFNRTQTAISFNSSAVSQGGTELKNDSLTLAGNSAADLPYHQTVGPDTLGAIFSRKASGQPISGLKAEMIRVFPRSDGSIGYIAPVRSVVIP